MSNGRDACPSAAKRTRRHLQTAQREIATDWIAAYKKYVDPSPMSGHHRLGYTGAGLNGSAPPDSRSEASATGLEGRKVSHACACRRLALDK
jgi:hypothetical protein